MPLGTATDGPGGHRESPCPARHLPAPTAVSHFPPCALPNPVSTRSHLSGALAPLPLVPMMGPQAVASSPERSEPGSTCGQTAPASAGGENEKGRRTEERGGVGHWPRNRALPTVPQQSPGTAPLSHPAVCLLLRPTSCLHSPPTPSPPATPTTQPGSTSGATVLLREQTRPCRGGRDRPQTQGPQDAALIAARRLSCAPQPPRTRHTSQVTSQTLQQEGRRFSSGKGSSRGRQVWVPTPAAPRPSPPRPAPAHLWLSCSIRVSSWILS